MVSNIFYYMEESVLLGTKPLVDSIRHFIRDPSGVFSVYIHTYIHTYFIVTSPKGLFRNNDYITLFIITN